MPPHDRVRYQDLERSRTLWLDCLAIGHLARSTNFPDIYAPQLAETAFAAAWASLDFWDVGSSLKSQIETELSRTANFLHTLRSAGSTRSIEDLTRRLRLIPGVGESRTEIWAYLIGRWLLASPLSNSHEELLQLGWPSASFGWGYWHRRQPQYRENGSVLPLAQPFSKKDAFDFFGPFQAPDDSLQLPRGESLYLASLAETKGLRASKIWALEALLGSMEGVLRTRVGLVHRQFAAPDLPEWFEAVEVYYDSPYTDLVSLLKRFWGAFPTAGDLLFYQTEAQVEVCRKAWSSFQEGLPRWATPSPLQIRPVNWFEPSKAKEQKLALQGVPALKDAFSKLDLSRSHLATKVNAFAAGHGSDSDVVLLAARYGLDAGLTLALRTVRYFAEKL